MSERICSVKDCANPAKARGLCNGHYLRFLRHGDPLAGAATNGEPQRFYTEHALTYEGDDCLFWPFGRTGAGRACIIVDGRSQFVHRLVCKMHNGPPPTPKHHAAHSCGNGHLGCVTKRHLKWATAKENAADKLLHGTSQRGAKNGKTKLTEDAVRKIRALKDQMPQREIAAMFSVSTGAISDIFLGDAWSWLP